MSKINLGRVLKEYREKRGLTVKELSTLTDKGIKAIYSWECGNSQPDVETLLVLCKLYGIDSIENLYENKEPYSNLPSDKQELLKEFDKISDGSRNRILDFIKIFDNLTDENKDKALDCMKVLETLSQFQKEKQHSKKNKEPIPTEID